VEVNMRGLIAICIVAYVAFGCSDDGDTSPEPCEGSGCFLLGCSWEASNAYCNVGLNGLEYAGWTETSFDCDNPEHDGWTQAGRIECQEWETCVEANGMAGCEIE
jgi:hypothetical protein